MKIAIIADIHGNLVGLDAVLADLDGEQPDHLICLGDLAAGGPQPAEAVERVRALGCPVIMGNGDAWMAEWAEPGQPPEQSPDRQLLDIARWCHEQLSADDLRYLAKLDATYHLALGHQMSMLCFHGSPQSYYDVITATTSDEELERMLGPVTTTILIGGHTHVQMLRRYKEADVINPGSAGLPHGRVRSKTPIRIPPCAEYAVISVDRGSLRTDLRRVPISLDALRRSALESGMPHAAWWAQRWGPQMQKAFWRAMGYALPAAPPVAELTRELLSYLGWPDPGLRDHIGYLILGTWIGRGPGAEGCPTECV